VPLVYSLYLKFARDRLVAFKKIFCVTIPSFVLFGLLAILLTIMYDPQIYWMKRVNQALKGRLSLGQNAINNYGIHLFGKHIEMTGNGMDAYGQISTETYSYVDSFYVQILLRYGIVFVLVLAFMLTVVMYRSYKNNYFYLLFVLTLIGIHYIIDDLQLYLYYNTFWFAIGNVFINRNSKKYLLPEDKIVA
jgi:predicted PurR-regulated permease PerM